MNKEVIAGLVLALFVLVLALSGIVIVHAQESAPVEWRDVRPVYPKGFTLYWATTSDVEFVGFNIHRNGVQINTSHIPATNIPELGTYYIYRDDGAVPGDVWMIEMVFDGHSLWSDPLSVNKYGRPIVTSTPTPTQVTSPILTPPPSPLGHANVVISDSDTTVSLTGANIGMLIVITAMAVLTIASIVWRRK